MFRAQLNKRLMRNQLRAILTQPLSARLMRRGCFGAPIRRLLRHLRCPV